MAGSRRIHDSAPESGSSSNSNAQGAQEAPIAPILVLSDDILSKIFHLCIAQAYPTHVLRRTHPLWRLSHVCKTWRLSLLSNPKLWSTISYNDTSISIKDSTCQLLSLVLKRSYPCPLELGISSSSSERLGRRHGIGMHDPGSTVLENDSFQGEHDIHPILKIFMDESERWGNIQLDIPFEMFQSLLPIKGRLPVLERLRLNDASIGPGFGAPDAGLATQTQRKPYDVFSVAPSLRHVECYTNFVVELPWNQLISLSTSTEEHISYTLKSSPPVIQSLQIHHLGNSGSTSTSSSIAQIPQNSHPIHVNGGISVIDSLTSLSFYIVTFPTASNAVSASTSTPLPYPFLSTVSFPFLTSLTMTSYSSSSPRDATHSSLVNVTILPLLERSACKIQYLTMAEPSSSSSGLLTAGNGSALGSSSSSSSGSHWHWQESILASKACRLVEEVSLRIPFNSSSSSSYSLPSSSALSRLGGGGARRKAYLPERVLKMLSSPHDTPALKSLLLRNGVKGTGSAEYRLRVISAFDGYSEQEWSTSETGREEGGGQVQSRRTFLVPSSVPPEEAAELAEGLQGLNVVQEARQPEE
jgi:hypothetical protein